MPILLLLVAVAAALAVVPARATAAACPGAPQPLGPASAAAVAGAVLCLVNDERLTRGLAPVRRDGALEAVAQRHAADMVARGYFAHVSPSGGTVEKRARRAGYLTAPCWALGEDLARAPGAVASAEAVVAAWMASPGHRSVILDPDFGEGGIGLVPRASDGDGATVVLELGALVPCAGAAPRARVRAS